MKTISIKRIYLLTIALVAVAMCASADPTAYAELNGNTLTFRYGEKPTGKVLAYDASDTGSDPKWSMFSRSVVNVVFDSSFMAARPKSCASWFYGMDALRSVSGIGYLNTSDVTNMSSMFYGCSSLTSLDVSGFNTSNVISMSSMFSGCSSLTGLNVSGFNTSNVISMSTMFYGCSSLTSLDVSGFNTSNVKNMYFMFDHCSNLTSLDVSGFNTSNVTDMSSMFCLCSKVKALDVSGFNTSNVMYMRQMFSGCSSLTSLDVSGFNTSKVTNMSSMFSDCSSLTSLDVSGFNTSNVTGMGHMFYECSNLTVLDVSGFNTSNVTDMGSMFSGCSILTNLDVSGFNTSKVTNMSSMFEDCSSLTSLDVSGFNTSNVTNMSFVFLNCSNLTSLDVSGFNTSKVTNMSAMFGMCESLTTIYCNNAWQCEYSPQMFYHSMNLVGAVPYDYRNENDVTYATPARYFTRKPMTGLRVAGYNVTEENCGSLTAIEGVSGVVTYDYKTHTLNLNNATIKTKELNGISSSLNVLTLNLKGNNTITADEALAISSSGNIYITGTGSLVVTGESGIKMSVEAGKKNIISIADGARVTIAGTISYGFMATGEGRCTFNVSNKNTIVKVKGTNDNSMYGIDNMQLDSVEIADPFEGRLVNGIVCNAFGNPVRDWVTISSGVTYQLRIAENVVGSNNCRDLSGLPGVSGTISYNPHNKTLTLQDATITNTAANSTYNNNSGYGILNMIDGLTIKIEGDNTITSEQWDGLASVGNLTITGNGTLNINAKGTSLNMIGGTSYYLTINGGAKVFSKGMYGVYGGTETVQAGGGQLTYSYVTHLRVSGAKTELHVFGTEQCAQLIAFLEMDEGMEMRGESGKAYFEQNSFCYFERHRYQPYVNQWVTIKYPDTFILGDVNGDGYVTMADANAVVNYFLAADKSSITNFNVSAANVNGDDGITMADANAIVNMFLAQ